MKILKLSVLTLLLAIFGCSSEDDNSDVENGINRTANLKATGSSGNDFLSAAKYNAIVMEVLYVEGFHPNAQTLINLKNFMEVRLNKPGGITIVEREIASPGISPYDINEVASIETLNRTKYNNGNILTLSLLFLDGKSSSDTSNSFTLGTAYRNTSFVIFENSVQSLSDSVTEPDRTTLETVIILHEFCHLLGLVNLGTPMVTEHLDEAHDKHCDNPDCLMYWETENSTVVQSMLAGNLPTLDAHCIEDLQANGGK